MPGIIRSAIETQDPLNKITGYEAEKPEVNEGKDTVQGQIEGIIAKNSPLMQQARTRAKQAQNQKGTLNSSMAIQAGQAAVYEAALPIAQQDAATNYDANKTGVISSNQASEFTANAANTGAIVERQGQQNIEQIEAQSGASINQMREANKHTLEQIGATGEQTRQNIEAQGATDVTKISAQGQEALDQIYAGGQIDLANIAAQGGETRKTIGTQTDSAIAQILASGSQERLSIAANGTEAMSQIIEQGNQASLLQAEMRIIDGELLQLEGNERERAMDRQAEIDTALQKLLGGQDINKIVAQGQQASALQLEKATIDEQLITAEGDVKLELLNRQGELDDQIQDLRGEQALSQIEAQARETAVLTNRQAVIAQELLTAEGEVKSRLQQESYNNEVQMLQQNYTNSSRLQQELAIINERLVGAEGDQRMALAEKQGMLEQQLQSIVGDQAMARLKESSVQEAALMDRKAAIDKELLTADAATKITLMQEQSSIDSKLALERFEQEGALQAQRIFGEAQLILKQGDVQEKLLQLEGDLNADLEQIKADNNLLLQTSQSAAMLYANTASAIGDVLSADLPDGESKAVLVKNITENFQNGLEIIGKIGNMDLASILDFTNLSGLFGDVQLEPTEHFFNISQWGTNSETGERSYTQGSPTDQNYMRITVSPDGSVKVATRDDQYTSTEGGDNSDIYDTLKHYVPDVFDFADYNGGGGNTSGGGQTLAEQQTSWIGGGGTEADFNDPRYPIADITHPPRDFGDGQVITFSENPGIYAWKELGGTGNQPDGFDYKAALTAGNKEAGMQNSGGRDLSTDRLKADPTGWTTDRMTQFSEDYADVINKNAETKSNFDLAVKQMNAIANDQQRPAAEREELLGQWADWLDNILQMARAAP